MPPGSRWCVDIAARRKQLSTGGLRTSEGNTAVEQQLSYRHIKQTPFVTRQHDIGGRSAVFRETARHSLQPTAISVLCCLLHHGQRRLDSHASARASASFPPFPSFPSFPVVDLD